MNNLYALFLAVFTCTPPVLDNKCLLKHEITEVSYKNLLVAKKIDSTKSDRQEKSNNTLSVKIDNNKTIKFTDKINKQDETKNIIYKYFGYSKKTSNHIIQAMHYEFSDFLLVSQYGDIVRMWSIPYISNDARTLVALSQGIEYQVYNNGFQVFNFRNNKLFLKCEKKISLEEPVELRWSINNSFALKLKKYDTPTHGKIKEIYILFE